MDFDRRAVRRWRREVYRAFEYAGLKPHQIQAALVMAGVEVVGTHVLSLSEITGLSDDYVAKVLRRLRQQRMLSGQTLRVRWDHESEGDFSALLDGMVACGILTRPVDEKRSAAQKSRAPETRHRGPRRKSATVVGPFAPKHQKSNPYYGLPEWEKAAK